MSEVRPVTVEEIPLIPTLGMAFYKEANLPGTVIPEVFIRHWTTYYDLQLGIMIGLFREGRLVGVIGGLVVPDTNDGKLVASEMFWYVREDQRVGGLRLLRAFEQWAVGRGAQRVSMVHLCGENAEKLGRYYQHQGYAPVEIHYLKTLAS